MANSASLGTAAFGERDEPSKRRPVAVEGPLKELRKVGDGAIHHTECLDDATGAAATSLRAPDRC